MAAAVFVSHVHEDAPIALEIAVRLENAGYSTWCYEKWREVISSAVAVRLGNGSLSALVGQLRDGLSALGIEAGLPDTPRIEKISAALFDAAWLNGQTPG